jgi:hypothetical protein
VSSESPTVSVGRVSPEGMTLQVSAFGQTRDIYAPSLSPQAEQFFVDSCHGAHDFDDAVTAWRKKMEPFASLRPSGYPSACVVIDGSDQMSGDEVVAWGRLLARLHTPECKTVMLCGGVVVDPASDYDTLGALAAALIRQRLGLFIGVGNGAKPISTQVGLEGSWDGESVWAETPTRAYDYLCDQVHESDVVVVVGVRHQDLADLMTLWGGVVR